MTRQNNIGFDEARTAYVVNASQNPDVSIGQRRRVGGIGQIYTIASEIDADTVMIHTDKTDEDLPYLKSEAARDPIESEPAVPDRRRFAELVGQYKTIGDCGPTYQVVSIVDDTYAKIWIIPNEDDDIHRIESILLDPMHVD